MDKREAVLQKLTFKRDNIFSRLQSVHDKLLKSKGAENPEVFEQLLDLKGERVRYEEIILEIFELQSETDAKARLPKRELEAFDTLYEACLARSVRLKAEAAPPLGSTNQGPTPSLPKIKLVEFDGRPEDWRTFHDTFVSLVHGRDLSDIDKFHYLLGALRGPPLQLLKQFPVVDKTYKLAWQRLIQTYKDERGEVQRQINTIFEFEKIGRRSKEALESWVTTFEGAWRTLNEIKIKDLGDCLMCHLGLRALDVTTRQKFEENASQTEIPSFKQLLQFVLNQINVLKHSQEGEKPHPKPKTSAANKSPATRMAYAATKGRSKLPPCSHCSQHHSIYRCVEFQNLPVPERVARVQELGLCDNCLKAHDPAECSSKFKCVVCGRPHHVLLHAEREGNNQAAPKHHVQGFQARKEESGDTTPSGVLGTISLRVRDAFNKDQICRAVLDSGAQVSFITLECVMRLGLTMRKCPFTVYGLGNIPVKTYGIVSCNLQSNYGEGNVEVQLVVLRRVAGEMPNVHFPKSVIAAYKHLDLADPAFHVRSKVDILLGNEILSEIILDKPVTIKDDIPQVVQSTFGYIISGRLQGRVKEVSVSHLYIDDTNDSKLEAIVRRFWEIEEIPAKPTLSPADQTAEEMFKRLHYRKRNGQYVVPLLIKPDRIRLGNSRAMAERRWKSLESKLIKTPELQRAYKKFMQEYLSLGHMKEFKGDGLSLFLIPHHGILKPDSCSTPLRVVFDASARSSNNVSLNDILLPGPNLYPNIAGIIVKFRLFQYCFVTDICKMFRAIDVRKGDRKYQHILYRESPQEDVKTYELKTVTYGLSCSPFLAIRTLLQLVEDEGKEFPQASLILKDGVYMDDILFSCDTIAGAMKAQSELIKLLKRGRFELKKWASNTPQLLKELPPGDQIRSVEFGREGAPSSIKVLGLQWKPSMDNFTFEVHLTDHTNTKRSLLRILASIYDPVGFIAPCLFKAKTLLQATWKANLGWDDQLPPKIKENWSTFLKELPVLAQLRFERHLLAENTREGELIGFCDASNLGYAACVYMISRGEDNAIKVSLVSAKSRVAPLKPLTIPRLELMGALLLSKLMKSVLPYMSQIEIKRIFAFTDSTIVLSWLDTPTHELDTFIRNRVVQIKEGLTSVSWSHIRSAENIADIACRGAYPAELVRYQDRWFHGPHWLRQDTEHWPLTKSLLDDKTEEDHSIYTANLAVSLTVERESTKEFCECNFERFSSYEKLIRSFAYVYRLIQKGSGSKGGTPLSSAEIRHCEDNLIRLIQQVYFAKEWHLIKNGQGSLTTLRKLTPFIDDENFIRVGGRLNHAALPYNTKHPRLLPKDSRLTRLLIRHYHVKYFHAGPRLTHSIVSRRYWIMGMRRLTRSVIGACVTCRRCSPQMIQPPMAPLPAARVSPGKVFEHVGVDLGGPLTIKEGLRRSARLGKAYLALFICLATKAVHLELLSSLSAECFLATLDRFIARRGLPAAMYSDCGTNFVAASRHLMEAQRFLLDERVEVRVQAGCASRGISWRFNPPGAPHMGGLWEAGIKAVKYHLVRAVGSQALTFEELGTTLCRIEAILNSRPLCTMPADSEPEGFDVLTPAHFLIGRSLLTVPEGDISDVAVPRLSRWQRVQQCAQVFWKTWRAEYLNTLQQRQKWTTGKGEVKEGDVVFVSDEKTPPCKWPLARVLKVHPGSDGVVRSVTLVTSKGYLRRPVIRLNPLPPQ